MRRSWASDAPISSRPSNSTLPSIVVFGPRVSPIRVIAHTDLPEPDSPTIASTSPRPSANDTPATACTLPSLVANETLQVAHVK